MLNGLDLFSGIGGLTLALSPWVRPIAYCENDRYAQGVILSRIKTGELPNAPIWDDVKTLRGEYLPEIDIVYGGFPCQDVSVAGNRKGLEGERTGLFREAIRLIRECRPKFVFLENVPGIRRYVPTIRQELEALGYDCRDGFLSAAEVGAKHLRNRWWLLAYCFSEGLQDRLLIRKETQHPSPRNILEDVITNSLRKENEPECLLGRVANGVSYRVDRIRGLGNAVVPRQAQEAFMRLAGIRRNQNR